VVHGEAQRRTKTLGYSMPIGRLSVASIPACQISSSCCLTETTMVAMTPIKARPPAPQYVGRALVRDGARIALAAISALLVQRFGYVFSSWMVVVGFVIGAIWKS